MKEAYWLVAFIGIAVMFFLGIVGFQAATETPAGSEEEIQMYNGIVGLSQTISNGFGVWILFFALGACAFFAILRYRGIV